MFCAVRSTQPKQLRLREPLDLEEYFLDTTALKANIHFPVDWVLLRDGVRTLMKATTLIRDQGLKGRMQPPQEFLRRINRLSIEMTHQRRAADCRRGRKRVLRQMKKLVKMVRAHARRHRQLLEDALAADRVEPAASGADLAAHRRGAGVVAAGAAAGP